MINTLSNVYIYVVEVQHVHHNPFFHFSERERDDPCFKWPKINSMLDTDQDLDPDVSAMLENLTSVADLSDPE